MKIRSITAFYNPLSDNTIESLSSRVAAIKSEMVNSGWDVQTLRLSTIPFGQYTTPSNCIGKIQSLAENARHFGFDYLSIGPARLSQPWEYEMIPQLFAETQDVFASAFLSHPQKGISIHAVQECARIIVRTAKITADGFANLRFCALSNVRPFIPFFPASYGYGKHSAFAFAIETADAAVKAFQNSESIPEGQQTLLRNLNRAARELGKIADRFEGKNNFMFKGFDFSLAPFPQEWCSLAKAVELINGQPIGTIGSLYAASILAGVLDEGTWKKVGFNGLMFPVLEDSVLADRSREKSFSIKDLIMYSAVCGTGLDIVPLPGDIAAENIQPLLMDIAALSLRLHKPLTARLMPLPGFCCGDITTFDFDFFRNGRILDFEADSLNPITRGSEWLKIIRRLPVLH